MAKIKLTIKQRNKIKRAVKSLNEVLDEIQVDNPDKYINWYLEDTANFNLMEGDSHTGDSQSPNTDAVIECFDLELASGGGW